MVKSPFEQPFARMALERKKPRGRLSFPGHPAGFTVRPLRETPHGNLRL